MDPFRPPSAVAPSDQLVVFESTKKSYCQSIGDAEETGGVQFHPLEDKHAGYPGMVAVRPLTRDLTDAMQEGLIAFATQMKGRSFPKVRTSSFRSVLNQAADSSLTDFFCGQLVAAALQSIGLLPAPPAPTARPAHCYTPEEFASDSIQFSPADWKLGPLIYLKGCPATHDEVVGRALRKVRDPKKI